MVGRSGVGQSWGDFVWKGLRRSEAGYAIWLWRHFGIRPGRPTRRPRKRPPFAVLGQRLEVEEAAREVSELGLPAFGIPEKFWDGLAALGAILDNTNPQDAVLDAGAETYSPVLPWLARYGYGRLIGCNLVFSTPEWYGSILYEHGDITRTHYADGQFGAVSCMSVIEHGVDVRLFFTEMRRILKERGLLVISTDYWEDPIDAGDRKLFGVPQRIFTRRQAEELVATARQAGFVPLAPPMFECRDKVISWNGLDYTFLLMTFRVDSSITA
jgi:SAM-dependent methyltransferase